MIRIGTTQLWVHDQDEALEFWTAKVGLEIQADVTLPEIAGFRWLVVGAPTQQPYGIDAAFRDPSGNNIRLAQLPG